VGYHACKRLVDENLVPEEHKSRVLENLKQYEQIVMQIQAEQAKREQTMRMAEEVEKEEEKKRKKMEKQNRVKKGTKSNQQKRGKQRAKAKR